MIQIGKNGDDYQNNNVTATSGMYVGLHLTYTSSYQMQFCDYSYWFGLENGNVCISTEMSRIHKFSRRILQDTHGYSCCYA